MERNIELLNVIYQNAEMGIVGIDEILYKIKNPKLQKEILNERKEYQRLLKDVKKHLKKEHGKSKPVNMMTKLSSEIYSEMKLFKNNSDKIIIKMMIEGSYKSIGILTTKEMEYITCSDDIKNILKKFIKILNNNIANLKEIDKIC